MSIFCTGWWYRLSVPAFSLQIQGKERDILRVRRGVGEPNRIYTLLPKKEGYRDE